MNSLFITVSIEFILIISFSIYLLRKYAHRDSSFIVKFFTFVGWNLGFSIIAILPLDIYIVIDSRITAYNSQNTRVTWLINSGRSGTQKSYGKLSIGLPLSYVGLYYHSCNRMKKMESSHLSENCREPFMTTSSTT